MGAVAVVGGGVIGLATAWQAARNGWKVTVYDSAPGQGASWVAGGMNAPYSEGLPGENEVLALGVASLQRWPEFGASLESLSGQNIFTSQASLDVAVDDADIAQLRVLAEFCAGHGYEFEELTRSQIRKLQPALTGSIRYGLLATAESAVNNRLCIQMLLEAGQRFGVRFVEEEVTDLDALTEDQIVLATGHRASELWPSLPVRPVKGEILRLRRRLSAVPPPTCTVRGTVHGRPVYLVPRADGIALGATQFEAGEDTQVTATGVTNLLCDAQTIMPSLGEYELYESIAGLRPMSPDNNPLIGRLSDRVIAAVGHGRNGFLLTPITAEIVVQILQGTDPRSNIPEALYADPFRSGMQVMAG